VAEPQLSELCQSEVEEENDENSEVEKHSTEIGEGIQIKYILDRSHTAVLEFLHF
jgi:hypothetical protein